MCLSHDTTLKVKSLLHMLTLNLDFGPFNMLHSCWAYQKSLVLALKKMAWLPGSQTSTRQLLYIKHSSPRSVLTLYKHTYCIRWHILMGKNPRYLDLFAIDDHLFSVLINTLVKLLLKICVFYLLFLLSMTKTVSEVTKSPCRLGL